MKQLFLLFALNFIFCSYANGQISYAGCEMQLDGAYPFTLSLSGTTSSGGTMRNTYTSAEAACGLGETCAFSIIWQNNRWEIIVSYDGVDYLLYTNDNPSFPNPPALTLGNWVNVAPCTTSITTLSGDVQATTVLPVELSRFTGQVKSEDIRLSWQTASELNNEKFEIERSINGKDFQMIGTIKGNGTTNEEQDYTFEDKRPSFGFNYYRLKQIDFDGAFEYSETIVLEVKEDRKNIGKIYPNPSQNGLAHLDYASSEEETINVLVFDLAGQLLWNQTHATSKGINRLDFDFSNLSTGMYIVKIGNNENATHQRLIIE